jgi:signal transduction histidine kinase
MRLEQLLHLGRSDTRRRAPAGLGDPPPERTTPFDVGDLAVAQLVHDLRNQVTIMRGCAENLAALVPKGQADAEIAELQATAVRVSLLTREILLAPRPGRTKLEQIDLNRVVVTILKTLLQVCGDRINLRLSLCPDPVLVLAEHIDIERILLNLALNARDAMAGEGVLTIETALVERPSSVASAGAPLGRHPRLTVGDTGCGMAPEVQARIFEPYFTTKPMGAGLGLTSVSSTLSQIHAAIAVQSTPDRGTSVTVTFPPLP